MPAVEPVAFGVWVMPAVEPVAAALALGAGPPVADVCEEDGVCGFDGEAGGGGAAVVASSNAANGWTSVCCA
jgi:hypothetical protein